MSKLPNYIQAQNPFRLAGPPAWFLRQLYDFDDSLIILPSKQGFYYRLAQRRPLMLKEQVVNDVLKEQADTRMLASYGLVPVTTILATANWSNPLIFEDLRRRAPWRMGGAAKFAKLVEAQERIDAINKKTEQDDKLNYLAKDAWRYYNKKIGVRSHLYSPVVKSDKAPNTTTAIIIPGSRSYIPEVTSAWGNVLKHNDPL